MEIKIGDRIMTRKIFSIFCTLGLLSLTTFGVLAQIGKALPISIEAIMWPILIGVTGVIISIKLFKITWPPKKKEAK